MASRRETRARDAEALKAYISGDMTLEQLRDRFGYSSRQAAHKAIHAAARRDIEVEADIKAARERVLGNLDDLAAHWLAQAKTADGLKAYLAVVDRQTRFLHVPVKQIKTEDEDGGNGDGAGDAEDAGAASGGNGVISLADRRAARLTAAEQAGGQPSS